MIKLRFIFVALFFYGCVTKNIAEKKQEEKTKPIKCYKQASGFLEQQLPKDVCIGKNEKIYAFYNKFDFNFDGLQDIAIEKGPRELKNGDLTQLVIYEQNALENYTIFKTLDNIFPHWFSDYNPSNITNDVKLDSIKKIYIMGNPLDELLIKENKIIFKLNADVGFKYVVTYVFDIEKRDWILKEYTEYDLYNKEKKTINKWFNLSISKFSYFEYLN